MRQTLLVVLALLAAFVLGTLQRPAHAENLEELSTSALLAKLVMAQKEQAENLKAIALGGELIRRQREQAESLKTIADAQRDQTEALKTIARAAERGANR
jgi:hypothetical protein